MITTLYEALRQAADVTWLAAAARCRGPRYYTILFDAILDSTIQDSTVLNYTMLYSTL